MIRKLILVNFLTVVTSSAYACYTDAYLGSFNWTSYGSIGGGTIDNTRNYSNWSHYESYKGAHHSCFVYGTSYIKKTKLTSYNNKQEMINSFNSQIRQCQNFFAQEFYKYKGSLCK